MDQLQPEKIEQLTSAVVETPVYCSNLSLTKSQIANAEVMASQGYFSLAAQICNTILKDDRIWGAFQNRVSELTGSEIDFDGDAMRPKTALFDKEDFWSILPEATFKQIYIWTLLMGFSVCQLVWKEHNGRELPTVVFFNPQNLIYNRISDTWFLRSGAFGENIIPLTFGDGQWVMFKHSQSNPWNEGLWLRLAKLYLQKMEASDAWIYNLAHYGNGITVIKNTSTGAVDKPNAKADADSLLEKITSADKRVGIYLNSGMDIAQLEPNSKATWEGFRSALEYADDGITIAIVGSNLTTSAESGFAGLGTVQRITNLSRINSDAQIFSTQIREQILVPYCEVNFGNANAAPYPVWQAGQDLKTTKEAAMLQMKSQGIISLVEKGIMTIDEARTYLGLGGKPA